jgi:hypothetical protein
MYCEIGAKCPICGEFFEFDSRTYDNAYEVHKCGGCNATAVMDSFTPPTESGLRSRQGEIAIDIQGLFDYAMFYGNWDGKEFLERLAHPEIIKELTLELKEIYEKNNQESNHTVNGCG